jgi:outer membrane protein insertion porin family
MNVGFAFTSHSIEGRDMGLSSAFVLVISTLSAILALAPQAAAQNATFRLAGIELTGAKRYTAADISKIGGVSIGHSISVEDLAAAANRMGASGFFKSLNDRYVTKAGNITVTFELDEADWTIPVVFDNFVWLPDTELIALVRQDVPSFDGTAPMSEGVIGLIAESLAGVVKSRQLPGQVRYTPEGDLKGNLLRHVFAVKEPAPVVCALRVEGTAAIPEAKLLEPVREIVGGEYSRVHVTAVARGTLTNLYQQRGHWRASFTDPVVKMNDGCAGVSVDLTVSEGAPYAFERAEWIGNSAMPSAELDKVLTVNRGDIANIMKLEESLRQLHKAYGKRGYVMQSAKYTPRLDDTSRRAVFDVTIAEGAQFRMGAIEFGGFDVRVAEALQKKWRLEPGDVFDVSAVGQFEIDAIVSFNRANPSTGKHAAMELRADPEKRTVDVKVVLK